MRSVVLKLDSNDELAVEHFSIVEAMSAAFQVHAIAQAREDMIIHQVGKPASFLLASDRGVRTWTGIATSIVQDHISSNGMAKYSILLAPELWLLQHRTNHRLFQHLSIPEIAQKLLHDWHIQPELRLSGKFPKLELRVQYGESDYDFFRRMLVEAGISFFFEPTKEGISKLVLSDAPHTAAARHEAPIPWVRDHGGMEHEGDHVSHVSLESMLHATRAIFADHDFRRPRFKLAGEHTSDPTAHPLLEQYHYAPGQSAASHGGGGGTPVADSQGAYRHQDTVAKDRAAQHLDALRSAAAKVAFQTSLMDLAPGTVFAMDGHPHPELALAQKLLVTASWINGMVNGHVTTGGHAVRADKPYRPLLTTHAGDPTNCGQADPFTPVTQSTKPRIYGVQSAIVVGPPGEEIHTDEHGRVRVHFPWDREGQSSSWVRVSQASAGAGFGNMQLPRVGQEVLVSFLDGDPDHPVIVGRLHNATTPEPYALPDHKTRTTWKSGSPGGGNEVTFDDKKGGELLYMQAERDLHKVVKQNELEHTAGDRHLSVDGDFIIHAKGKIVLQGDVVHVTPLQQTKDPTVPKQPAQLSTGKPLSSSNESASARANQQLFKMDPGNRPDSIRNAQTNRALAEKYKPLAEKLGKKYNLPPALVLAWMNRESSLGTALRPDGYSKYDGYGYGLLQVDRRYHSPTGDPFGEPSCDQAIGDVFDGMLSGVKKQHPDWSPEQQLAGALVDYNSGGKNAQTQPDGLAGWAAMDKGTANNNYSQDVWAQAQWFAKNLDW